MIPGILLEAYTDMSVFRWTNARIYDEDDDNDDDDGYPHRHVMMSIFCDKTLL